MSRLTELTRDVWVAPYRVAVGPLDLDSRMTVLRIGNHKLFVISPGPIDDDLKNELQSLGEVSFVVAPNLSHHLHLKNFASAFPASRVVVPARLKEKTSIPAEWCRLEDIEWPEGIQAFAISGLPMLDETVFYHALSKTLVCTDLFFNFSKTGDGLPRFLARLLGVLGRPAMSRTMRFCVRDKEAFRRSTAPLFDLQLDRIIVAHGKTVTELPKITLFQAISDALPMPKS